MPPSGTRLVWVTPAQEREIQRCLDDDRDAELGWLYRIQAAFDAAPEPVERRICLTHGSLWAGEKRTLGHYCQAKGTGNFSPYVPDCEFVSEWTTTTAPPEEAA